MVGQYHRLNGHEFGQVIGVGDGWRNLVCCSSWGHKVSDMTEQLNANAGDIREEGLIPMSVRYPGEGNDNTFQCSCPENSMDREVRRATVQGVAKNQT